MSGYEGESLAAEALLGKDERISRKRGGSSGDRSLKNKSDRCPFPEWAAARDVELVLRRKMINR